MNAEEKKAESYVKGNSAVNTNELQIVDPKNLDLNKNEIMELTSTIDRTIESLKNNRQEINRLTFECVSAMTEADDAQKELSRKGTLCRLIGGITGSNQKLQNKINNNRSIAQYTAQLTLQKLAEQNLMTFDLIAAVNSKMNASLLQVDKEFKNIYGGLRNFMRHNRNRLVEWESRMNAMEQSVEIIKWNDLIEYKEFNGIEYSALDPASKIVCLVRDFYDITKGNWSTSDLLYIKKTMKEVNLDPKEKVNYFDILQEIALNKILKDRLLGNIVLDQDTKAEYLISTSVLKKFDSLENKDSYMVDTVINYLKDNKKESSREKVCAELVKNDFDKNRSEKLDMVIESYDLILDLLHNLKQIDTNTIADVSSKTEETIDEQFIPAAETIVNEDTAVINTTKNCLPATDSIVEKNETPEETGVATQKNTSVREEYKLPSDITIGPNDPPKVISDKIIKFDSTIKCKGKLAFNNCEISYHNNENGQIELYDNSELSFENCILSCSSYSETPLIRTFHEVNNTAPSVTIKKCDFHNCTKFISGDPWGRLYPISHIHKIIVEECNFYDCFDFVSRIDLDSSKDSICEIIDCTFTLRKIADFYKIKYLKNWEMQNMLCILFHVTGYGRFVLDHTQVIVDESAINFREIQRNSMFSGDSCVPFKVKNECKFSGPCDFLSCVENISHCIFENAISAVNVLKDTADYCKFINCSRAIYADKYEGTVNIRECRFTGWSNSDDLLWLSSGVFKIENCVFENMTLTNHNGLFSVHADEDIRRKLIIEDSEFNNIVVEKTGILKRIEFYDPVTDMDYVRFEGCKFNNCTGQLVNCKASYSYKPFLRDRREGQIRISGFYNCTGIDDKGFAIN